MLKFSDEMQWALFRGKEMEGKRRGLETLFVAGNPPENEVLDRIKAWPTDSLPEFRQVYFGAGGLFRYDHKTVHDAADLLERKYNFTPTKIVVTVEHPTVDWGLLRVFKNLEWMVPVLDTPHTERGLGLTQVRQIAKLLADGFLRDPVPWTDLDSLFGRIQLKYDYKQHVMVFPAKDLVLAHYYEYHSDKLITVVPSGTVSVL